MVKVSLVLIVVLALSVSCRKIEESRVKLDGPFSIASPSPLASPTPDRPSQTKQIDQSDLEKRPAEFFFDGNELSVDGFTIQKRFRKQRADSYEPNVRNWEDCEYVVVKKERRILATFDGNLVHPLGIEANFGLFPFLGRDSRQVFISADLPRTGCQWIVSLSPRFRIIFDGQALGVGREGPDLSAVDLDNDGVYEIIAPITDFYQLQDKLYMAAIPLPDIIFKYDSVKQKYLPANPIFKDRVFAHLAGVPEFDKDSLNVEHRAAVLSNLLTYIYAGEQKRGWEAYEKDYKLEDKAEMKRRVKAILREQPVYKFIYRR